MDEGHLAAEKRRISGRKVWSVCEDDLITWAKAWLDPEELEIANLAVNTSEQVSEQERTTANVHEQPRTVVNEHERTELNTSEQSEHTSPSPPLELYVEMLDRLQRAERRAVELEMQLRLSQRLLTENAESIVEREARARQAEEKERELRESLAKTEAEKCEEVERLSGELEMLKVQVSTPVKSGGFLSWLGFRRSKSAAATDQNRSA